jgi:hypothetical protein
MKQDGFGEKQKKDECPVLLFGSTCPILWMAGLVTNTSAPVTLKGHVQAIDFLSLRTSSS